MAAAPGVQLDELTKPYLLLDSYRYEFETFKKVWLEYAPRLFNQDEDNLRDKQWKCVDRDNTTYGRDREDFNPEAVRHIEQDQAA